MSEPETNPYIHARILSSLDRVVTPFLTPSARFSLPKSSLRVSIRERTRRRDEVKETEKEREGAGEVEEEEERRQDRGRKRERTAQMKFNKISSPLVAARTMYMLAERAAGSVGGHHGDAASRAP